MRLIWFALELQTSKRHTVVTTTRVESKSNDQIWSKSNQIKSNLEQIVVLVCSLAEAAASFISPTLLDDRPTDSDCLENTAGERLRRAAEPVARHVRRVRDSAASI